jgi:hypothetical protein
VSNRLLRLVARYRGQLQQREQQTAQTLTAAHAQMTQEIQPHLEQLYQDVNTKQQDDDEKTIPLSWLHEGNRLEALGQFIRRQVEHFAMFAQITVSQVQQWATTLGNQVASLFMKVAQPDLSPVSTHPSVLSHLLSGANNQIAMLFGSFGKKSAKDVNDALTLGLSLGSSVRDIASQVTQALDEPRWRSITIAATEMYQAYNSTLLENYRTNAHVITGWVWICKFDGSCAACVALHGTVHRLSETLHDHCHGKCTPAGYRDGMDLPQSGVDWFYEQDEAVQREVMGTGVAYQMIQSGVPLEAFVGIDHDLTYGKSVYQKSAKQITKGK